MGIRARSISRMTIVDWEDGSDLRYVSHNVDYLLSVAKRYKLVDGQAVMFTNFHIATEHQKKDKKVRFVYMMGDIPVLIKMPVSRTIDVMTGIWISVHSFIRGMAATAKIEANLEKC